MSEPELDSILHNLLLYFGSACKILVSPMMAMNIHHNIIIIYIIVYDFWSADGSARDRRTVYI